MANKEARQVCLRSNLTAESQPMQPKADYFVWPTTLAFDGYRAELDFSTLPWGQFAKRALFRALDTSGSVRRLLRQVNRILLE